MRSVCVACPCALLVGAACGTMSASANASLTMSQIELEIAAMDLELGKMAALEVEGMEDGGSSDEDHHGKLDVHQTLLLLLLLLLLLPWMFHVEEITFLTTVMLLCDSTPISADRHGPRPERRAESSGRRRHQAPGR